MLSTTQLARTMRRACADLRLIAAASTLLLAGGISACSVVDSVPVTVDPGNVAGFPACSSEAGSYSLATTTWSFEIASIPGGPYLLQSIKLNQHPDSKHTYCLDYLASAMTTDELSVGYSNNGRTGLLDYLASFSIDRTSLIVKNLVKAIFVGLSRSPQAGVRLGEQTAPTPIVHGTFEVDPLDAFEMANLNVRLKDFGFCLVLDGYTFEPTASAAAYCNNPLKIVSQHPSSRLAVARRKSWLVPRPERHGVLYRPPLSYNLEIYTQDDPRHSPWQLRKMTEVKLENLAPIVSLGVDRATFAAAKIGMDFDNGLLKSVCISKTSEAAGFVEIPLEIVYGIVTLPAETIRAEFDRATSTRELVEAQTKLITVQQEYEAFLRNKDKPLDDPTVSKLDLPNCTDPKCGPQPGKDFHEPEPDVTVPAFVNSLCKPAEGGA
ncbi:hypothetical protein ACI2KT_30695 [Ensifer adhaerens]|uniref:hypothetical protein n=1 Tax=Ensifer adhaerens TaxID=106592 RepID=UPI00384FBFF8